MAGGHATCPQYRSLPSTVDARADDEATTVAALAGVIWIDLFRWTYSRDPIASYGDVEYGVCSRGRVNHTTICQNDVPSFFVPCAPVRTGRDGWTHVLSNMVQPLSRTLHTGIASVSSSFSRRQRELVNAHAARRRRRRRASERARRARACVHACAS